MALHLRRVWPLIVVAVFMSTLLSAPVAARADSLWWTRAYTGPADTPNGESDPIPVAGAFNGVSFAGASSGWAVGVRVDGAIFGGGTKSGFIAETRNGGSTWTPAVVSTPRELRAVHAISTTDVWAVGDYGTLAHYNGDTWTVSTVTGWTANKAFHGVTFADDGLHGWAVGDGTGVARTVDGGATWTIVTLPGTGPVLRAVTAVNETTAIAVGDGGAMRVLTGTTSTSRGSATGSDLFGITFADADHAWAVGSNAMIVKSDDGGLTWAISPRPIPEGYTPSILTMRSVAFSGPNEGLIVSTYQMVWRTTDGGSTWTAEKLSDPSWLGDLELRGVAFPGSAAAPVAVSRHAALDLSSRDQKARAFLGAWTGRVAAAPLAPTWVGVVDGGAPRPRIAVTWNDASSDEDGFVIERSQGSTSAFFAVADVGADVTSWTDASADWRSTWYYRVRSFRGQSVSEWTVSAGFAVDPVAPITTSGTLPAYYTTAATIQLAAGDVGGSGVAATHYTLDGSSPQNGTSIAVPSAPGTHTVTFWSVDVAGNEELPHKSASFFVDRDAPVTSSNALHSYDTAAIITLSPSDGAGGSGVARTYYRVDAGARQTGTSVPVPTGVGTHHVYFQSEDLAGNLEATKTVTFEVTFADTTAPITQADAVPYYAGSATIHLSADDGTGSGVAGTRYSLDGGAEIESDTVTVAQPGTHTLSFYSTDLQSNREATRSVSFTVVTPPSGSTPSKPDWTPPSITHGRSVKFSGYLMKHTAGTSPVRLYFYRYRSGKYVYYKWTYAKVSTVLTFSRYYDTTSVPYSGKWRVRAKHVHGSRSYYSSYAYFTAK